MKVIIGILLLICIGGLLYFNLDKRLYYFGRNDFDRDDLPLGIKPEYRPLFEGGFGLRDEYGFTIAARGNTYKNGGDEILIENVVSYCWGNDRVIVNIRDVDDGEYLIEFSRKEGTKDELNVNVFDETNNLLSSYENCYDLKESEEEATRLIRVRAILRFALLILVLGLIWQVVVHVIRNK